MQLLIVAARADVLFYSVPSRVALDPFLREKGTKWHVTTNYSCLHDDSKSHSYQNKQLCIDSSTVSFSESGAARLLDYIRMINIFEHPSEHDSTRQDASNGVMIMSNGQKVDCH